MTTLAWCSIAPRGGWVFALALGLACSGAGPGQDDALMPGPFDAAPVEAMAPETAPMVADAIAPDDLPAVADTLAADAPVVVGPPDTAPVAEVAPVYSGPLWDPIPAEPMTSAVTVVLEELVTMPDSRPAPPLGDPRLQRRARINHLGELPDGSGRLFVPDLNGRLYFIKDRTPHVYLDVGAEFAPTFWRDRGLGSGLGFVAFHPDFKSNGIFYTVHTEAGAALTSRTPTLPSPANPSAHGVLTEWTATAPAAETFAGTRREILRLGFQTYIHGIQEVNFNPTALPGDVDRGLLYLAVGDGGAGLASRDPQDLGKPQGKVLRIDPAGTNGVNGRYGIPSSNPFAGKPGALGEVLAYGLRDPHRFTWDQGPAPRMLLANIGEHNIESVYEVKPGDNFGWPEREGPFLVRSVDSTCSVYPLPANDASLGFTYPVLAYDHDPPPGFSRCLDTGDAIIGGFVYRGTGMPQLRGHYLFGDIVNGRVFHADSGELRRNDRLATIRLLALVDAQGQRVTMQTLAGDARVDLRFGRDAAGEIYVLSKANGKIWRMKAAVP